MKRKYDALRSSFENKQKKKKSANVVDKGREKPRINLLQNRKRSLG